MKALDTALAWFDRRISDSSRGLARRSSRRSFLARVGTLMVGAGALPL